MDYSKKINGLYKSSLAGQAGTLQVEYLMRQYLESKDEIDKGNVETVIEILILELKFLSNILSDLADIEKNQNLFPHNITKQQFNNCKINAREKYFFTSEKVWEEVKRLIQQMEVAYVIKKLAGIEVSVMTMIKDITKTYPNYNQINKTNTKIQLMKINTLMAEFHTYVKTLYIIYEYIKSNTNLIQDDLKAITVNEVRKPVTKRHLQVVK